MTPDDTKTEPSPYVGGTAPVRVDGASVLARYADWNARLRNRPVAAFGTDTQDAALFVADEVLVDGDDWELVQELQARHEADVVPEPPLPPPPAEWHRQARVAPEAMPRVARLRFRSAPRIDDAARLLARVAEARANGGGDVVVTSAMGAGVAAVAARYRLEGRDVGLNLFGRPFAMPLSAAQEGPVPVAGSNPFAWQAFSGRSRIVEAWQLVDSVRRVRGDRFTTIAILDTGFWLDARGAPMVAPGQAASDFGGAFVQVNLQNAGRPAGGMSPFRSPWHGNAVASAAAAAVANRVGAAGSGGTVAVPLFFQTDYSEDQALECARICAAWGVDVLNMSFGFWGQSELFFGTRTWDRTFQFAADHGVVMIAAAGNDDLDLPDDRNIRPATRTPGVLTVGALETDDTARPRSNHGSSVGLWAPGTAIPVAPDLANAAGSRVDGTSFAAPIVAGVAAMMRFANDRLSADDVRRILVDTGWQGAGRVTRGLDAFAAVFAAIRQTLPDTGEQNNTPATASELTATAPGGPLGPGPGGFTARSTASDRDYWKFRVDQYSTVAVAVDWYERLGTLSLTLDADDPDTRDQYAMARSGDASTGTFALTGLLPPGVYRVAVAGTGVTAYRLQVTRTPAPLGMDQFENNDSFARAAQMLFEATRWSIGVRTWSPGTYDATLHQERGASPVLGGPKLLTMDDDYFRLEVPGSTVGRRPRVSISHADGPIDVTLFDGAQVELQRWPGVPGMFAYPPEHTTCFLKVAAAAPTRYRITTRMSADPRAVPGPIQEELELIPKWWGDPAPLRLEDAVTHFAAEVNTDRGDGEALVFERPDTALRLALLDGAGQVLREAEAVDGMLAIDTRGVERGTYVLRAARDAGAGGRAAVPLRVLPPLR